MSTTATSVPLTINADRLLPADPTARQIARELYSSVADAPIFSPHGHVDPAILRSNEPFSDAASLLISPDHYITRVLHSHGVQLSDLGVGTNQPPSDPREVWRIFCAHWNVFLGTPSRYWLETELSEIFGITDQPSAGTADDIYDQIAERLARPENRPRQLFDRFRIEVLATTDDPASDLDAHRGLARDPGFTGAVIPTFRPDAYLDPSKPGWAERVALLGEITGLRTENYSQYLDALRARRRYFIENGATATDNGVPDTGSEPLTTDDASRLHQKALTAGLDAAEAVAYRRNMLFEMARMSTEDGLVMQLHPGVLRSHHRPTQAKYGDDTGHDFPLLTTYSEGLRPLLEAFGTDPRLRLVLFTVDETSFARDIAPLASFYPSVFIGAPWWFLDAPEAIARFRAATVETAGFYKTAGFVDDTRAFCSIPARHDMSRRTDAAYLAKLVMEHIVSEEDAAQVIHDLAVTLPRKVFTRTV